LLVALCSATAMPCHASHAMHRTAGRPALAAINLVSRLAHSDSCSHSHSHSHPLSLQPRDPQRLRNCVRAFILTALSSPMQKGGGSLIIINTCSSIGKLTHPLLLAREIKSPAFCFYCFQFRF
jgi:hypothetical protein